MFDIGFPELALASIVALLVLGPERLPGALRTLGLWIGRLRRSYYSVKTEIEREIGMDDVRRQLHNEQILSDSDFTRTGLPDLGVALEAAIRANSRRGATVTQPTGSSPR